MPAGKPSTTRTQPPLRPNPRGWGANPSSADYFPALTGLRGLAATMVLAMHAWQYAGAPKLVLEFAALRLDFSFLFAAGGLGVDLFFVLSGFLLTMPFHRAAAAGRPMPHLGRFWVRRCRRVLPAYWVQVLLLFLLYTVLQHGSLFDWMEPLRSLVARHPGLSDPLNLLQHLLLVQNLSPWQFQYMNAVYWSLPVEWDFYVVLPLIVLLLARCRWWLALLLVMFWVLAFRWLCQASWFDPTLDWLAYPWIIQMPSRLDEFFFGALGAWVLVNRPGWLARPRLLAASGALLMVGVAWYLVRQGDAVASVSMPGLLFQYSLIGAPFGMLVAGAAAQSPAGRVWFSGRVLGFLGVISYSLYLWHYPVLQLLQSYGLLGGGQAVDLLQALLVGLPPILLVSWLSWRCIERPCLPRSRRD